jgi:hypothetical protein
MKGKVGGKFLVAVLYGGIREKDAGGPEIFCGACMQCVDTEGSKPQGEVCFLVSVLQNCF